MPYNPQGVRLQDQENLYYHICRWYCAHPTAKYEDVRHLVEYFTPSFYITNGYFEAVSEDWLLENLVYDTRHTVEELSPRLRCIHFIQLYVPKNIQERLMRDNV